MIKKLMTGVLALVFFFSIFGLYGCGQGLPTLEIEEKAACVGDLVKINVSLSEAPNGVSGYNITWTLSNASVAEIESIELPDWGDNFLSKNSTLPAASVYARAIDIGMQIEENATDIPIITLGLRAKAHGHTTIYVSRLRMDDDDDRRIHPIIENGTLEVWQRNGDLNGNGKSADIGDVALMWNAYWGFVESDCRYDLNGDGIEAGIGDVLLIWKLWQNS